MSQIITQNDGWSTATLTVASEIRVDNPLVARMINALRAFSDSLKLTSVKLEVIGPAKYRYRWDTLDGRTWKQDLTVTTAGVRQTFNVNDSFLESEFALHRPARQCLMDAMVGCGLTALTVTWP